MCVVFIYTKLACRRSACVITYAHTSCVSAHAATMGGRDFTVAEWKKLASALHYGGLSDDIFFETTEAALTHLLQSHDASLVGHGERDRSVYRDYCYTHRNGPCPPASKCQLRMSMFFGHGYNTCCVLCNGLTIAQTTADQRFTYGVSVDNMSFEEGLDDEQVSLAHMTHLAVYHTPFFVMLILKSVASKQYSFHTNATNRRELAATVFDKYKTTQELFREEDERDIYFLKMWWRYMHRQSARSINMKIPYYLEMPNNAMSQCRTWTPAHDRFGSRKPEPIYTFVADHCVCRDVWNECATYAPRPSGPTVMRIVPLANGFTVHSLQTLVPKLHVEAVLDSIVTAHGPDGAAWASRALRVDTVILEESEDPNMAVLHLVISVQSTWTPLETWLMCASGNAPTLPKVALGVLWHLAQMFDSDTIPPRSFYKTPVDLIKTFFVNDTGDVTSLLPYLCMRKIYRAMNQDTDEIKLKKACGVIMAETLGSPGNSQAADALVEAWWHDGHGVSGLLNKYLSLCKNGLSSTDPVFTEEGYQQGAVQHGPAWSCGQEPVDEMILKLTKIGFAGPVRITIVSMPRTVPPEYTAQKTTQVPECVKGLAMALTVNAMNVIDDVSHPQQLTYPVASAKRLMTIDYDSNLWQHDTGGPVQPKIPHVQPDPSSYIATDFGFDDTEPNMAFFTHAIAGTSALQSLNDVAYDSNFSELLETINRFDNPAAAASPGGVLYDYAEATLPVVPDALLRHIDYAVVNVNEWGLPWVESDSAAPADQDVQAAEIANRPYETDTRRDTIAIISDRVHEHNGDDRELYPTPPVRDSPDQDHGQPANKTHQKPRRQPNKPPRPNDDVARTHSLDNAHACASAYVPHEPQAQRDPTDADKDLIARHPKWRSNGFQYGDLYDVYGREYVPHQLTFETPLIAQPHDPTISLKLLSTVPQTDPSGTLPEVISCIHDEHSTAEVSGVHRTASNVSEKNYKLGVEGSAKFARPLSYPIGFTYNSSVKSVMPDPSVKQPIYHAVDLSKPPERGFRHVHLNVNDFPVARRHQHILEISSKQALYLGHVVTVSNVAGLLVHRVCAQDLDVLDAVLTMHTSLQIHPFVARTFVMELMMLPFANTGVTANYVGEHVGEWNLGSPDGLAKMNDKQKCTLSYHVTLCLVKAQILTMTILGFPLMRLHPARIWRHGNEFRLDFLACLVDHITARLNAVPAVAPKPRNANKERLDSDISPVAGGVRAIATALELLELDEVAHITFKDEYDQYDEDIGVFYDMYQELTGTICGAMDSDLVLPTVLGVDEYLPFTVPTSDCRAEPFAPFHIQIHHQYVKWNRLVIVEPLLPADTTTPPVLEPHEGSPKVKYVKSRPSQPQPSITEASTSNEAPAPECTAAQPQVMRPPTRTARVPKVKARASVSNGNTHRGRADLPREAIPREAAGSPSEPARGGRRQPANAPRATTSRAARLLAPARSPEPTRTTVILDADYDMDTCGSTYYDG